MDNKYLIPGPYFNMTHKEEAQKRADEIIEAFTSTKRKIIHRENYYGSTQIAHAMRDELCDVLGGLVVLANEGIREVFDPGLFSRNVFEYENETDLYFKSIRSNCGEVILGDAISSRKYFRESISDTFGRIADLFGWQLIRRKRRIRYQVEARKWETQYFDYHCLVFKPPPGRKSITPTNGHWTSLASNMFYTDEASEHYDFAPTLRTYSLVRNCATCHFSEIKDFAELNGANPLNAFWVVCGREEKKAKILSGLFYRLPVTPFYEFRVKNMLRNCTCSSWEAGNKVLSK